MPYVQLHWTLTKKVKIIIQSLPEVRREVTPVHLLNTDCNELATVDGKMIQFTRIWRVLISLTVSDVITSADRCSVLPCAIPWLAVRSPALVLNLFPHWGQEECSDEADWSQYEVMHCLQNQCPQLVETGSFRTSWHKEQQDGCSSTERCLLFFSLWRWTDSLQHNTLLVTNWHLTYWTKYHQHHRCQSLTGYERQSLHFKETKKSVNQKSINQTLESVSVRGTMTAV